MEIKANTESNYIFIEVGLDHTSIEIPTIFIEAV